MPKDQPYLAAEKKIQQALQSGATKLDLNGMELTELPESIGQLAQLQSLNLSNNQLTSLPESLGQLTKLQSLLLSQNYKLVKLPEWIGSLEKLEVLVLNHIIGLGTPLSLPESLGKLKLIRSLDLATNNIQKLPEWLLQFKQLRNLTLTHNRLEVLPEWLGQLTQLENLNIGYTSISDLPPPLAQLEHLNYLGLNGNPLNPELSEAYIQGLDAVKAYLRAKSEAGQITLNEAKLILVGEGEVGKTCLMDALLGNEWQEHPSTHGIEIKSFKVATPDTQTEITLNGWDFGGQRVYRPTHQLFFSAPAVYLVVWKPREGSQAGLVKEWIQIVKHREPDAKILVVATHGGPQQRQPDIDRQELWDSFGRETVIDFFFVDSKPDAHGNRKGIDELKLAIARLAAELPEVGRSVPKSFQDVRESLQARSVPYLPLGEVLAICRAHKMDDEIARLFITISHRLGHLTHYQHDPALRDIVILRPDWLATAISYIFDDEITRAAHGLVRFSRLNHLWNDPTRPADNRYPNALHRIFLGLMGKFDLSYPVPALSPMGDSDPQSLIAQLVQDNRPENFETAWNSIPSSGDIQQIQICRIVDDKGNTATAEGLFYQLIVRLHKYSLGRAAYVDSIHWQRGLVLDDDYNGRALLVHKGNDVHITVRAPYPERFLAMLTEEVKYLVESFWEGLRCDVMVPCLNSTPCIGLFEVWKLIENKRQGRPEQPCPVCNEWQDIDSLLLNAPAARPDATSLILSEFAEVKAEVEKARLQLSDKMSYQGDKIMGRFDRLDDRTRRTLSIVDKNFSDLIQLLTNEAKEGPRLFSLVPVKRSGFNPKEWASEKFRLILWCEHIRLPLPLLNGKESKKGIYELELTREWFKKSAPLLKLMANALSLALPIAASGANLVIDKAIYDSLEDYFNFGKEVIDATLSASDKAGLWTDAGDYVDLPDGTAVLAENATLRELHSFLKEKDPGFGGLVRVMNKRQEFLWVHEKFAGEY